MTNQHLSAMTEPHYTDVTAMRSCKATVSLNHFELNADWGMSSVHLAEWAHAALERWLRSRVDAQTASVYDGDILMRGDEHV